MGGSPSTLQGALREAQARNRVISRSPLGDGRSLMTGDQEMTSSSDLAAQSGGEFAAFQSEAEGLPGHRARYEKFGRIRVFYVWGRALFIGPHWYCSIIMLCLILGVGGLFIFGIAGELGIKHLVAGFCVTFASTSAFLNCALADPGILHRMPASTVREEGADGGNDGTAAGDSQPAALQGRPLVRGRRCQKCSVDQPRGCSHCEFCEVCIEGFDHHCPWMGKCIGKKNISAFYTFIVVSFSSLAYILISTMWLTPYSTIPAHHHGSNWPAASTPGIVDVPVVSPRPLVNETFSSGDSSGTATWASAVVNGTHVIWSEDGNVTGVVPLGNSEQRNRTHHRPQASRPTAAPAQTTTFTVHRAVEPTLNPRQPVTSQSSKAPPPQVNASTAHVSVVKPEKPTSGPAAKHVSAAAVTPAVRVSASSTDETTVPQAAKSEIPLATTVSVAQPTMPSESPTQLPSARPTVTTAAAQQPAVVPKEKEKPPAASTTSTQHAIVRGTGLTE